MYRNETLSYESSSMNLVLKNTYILLGLTLLFSAMMSGASMALNIPPISFWIVLPGYFLLLFLVNKTANTAFGIVSTFIFTGFLGFTLGPMLSQVMNLSNGGMMIAQSLGGTALIFLSLSAYVISKKDSLDLSSWGPYIIITLLVSFVVSLLNFVFFQSSILGIAISIIFTIISSGLIMYETNQIINGGQRNYILATITLYIALYNIFVNLLSLIISFSGDD